MNSLTQAAGCAVLKHREYLQECTEKIKESVGELYAGLKALKEKKQQIRKLYPTSTNFVYVDIKAGETVFEGLKKAGISVRFIKGYLRICAGSQRENQEILQSLENLLQ